MYICLNSFQQLSGKQQCQLGENNMWTSVWRHYAGLSCRDLLAEARYCKGTSTLPLIFFWSDSSGIRNCRHVNSSLFCAISQIWRKRTPLEERGLTRLGSCRIFFRWLCLSRYKIAVRDIVWIVLVPIVRVCKSHFPSLLGLCQFECY